MQLLKYGNPQEKDTIQRDTGVYLQAYSLFYPIRIFSCIFCLKLDVGTSLLREGVLFKLNCPSTLPNGEELLLLKSAKGPSETLGLYLASFVPHSLFT